MSDGLFLKLAVTLPGVMLTTVASIQIYLAHFGVLTPSKGGGFGMFSVVDMRASRAWSVVGKLENGELCRVLIPTGESSFGRWLDNVFRANPDATARAYVVEQVSRARYVPVSYQQVERQRDFAKAAKLLPLRWKDTPLFRPAGHRDAYHLGEPEALQAVRLQAWRLRFDPQSNRVSCEQIGEPETRGQW